jgi:periplasmic protein TonB
VSDDAPTGGRRPYRPPVGIPEGDERRWRGLLASIAIHAAIVTLLLVPPVTAALLVYKNSRTAGMLGPRGGGGGGAAAPPEQLHFMEAAPTPAARTPAKAPPVPPPRPTIVVPERVPPPAPMPAPAALSPDTMHSASIQGGTGGPGAGPGTGGGVGTGTGTGVGSGKGPGTGGEGGTKIKATTKLVTAFSIDPPKRPRPFHLVAVFEVAANGIGRLLSVNKADDGDFNHRMRDRLLETEFKPATLANGMPVIDTVVVTADY